MTNKYPWDKFLEELGMKSEPGKLKLGAFVSACLGVRGSLFRINQDLKIGQIIGGDISQKIAKVRIYHEDEFITSDVSVCMDALRIISRSEFERSIIGEQSPETSAIRLIDKERAVMQRLVEETPVLPRANHYGGADNPYEAIKVIRSWELGFNLGNVAKYVCRAGKKPGESRISDLEKAANYLRFEIEEERARNEEH